MLVPARLRVSNWSFVLLRWIIPSSLTLTHPSKLSVLKFCNLSSFMIPLQWMFRHSLSDRSSSPLCFLTADGYLSNPKFSLKKCVSACKKLGSLPVKTDRALSLIFSQPSKYNSFKVPLLTNGAILAIACSSIEAQKLKFSTCKLVNLFKILGNTLVIP